MLIPGERKELIRQISVASGLALFVISFYVFADYSADGTEQFSFLLRYDWLENVGILGEDGISSRSVSTASPPRWCC